MKSLCISIVVFSTDPEQWKGLAQSLIPNRTDYEVIIAGPNRGKTPPRSRHIYTDVKPVQCYELGFREASGDLLLWCADYMRFCPEALDRAFFFFQSGHGGKKAVFFNNEKADNRLNPEKLLSDSYLHPLNILLPGMIDKDLLLRLGGLDKKFVCCHAEKDLAMRVRECGGALEVYRDAGLTAENAENDPSFLIFKSSSRYDFSVLKNLWTDGNKVLKNRAQPFEGFVKDTLLTGSTMQENRDSISSLSTVTQGPSGNWHGLWWRATRKHAYTIPESNHLQQPAVVPEICYKSRIQEPKLSIILTDWSCRKNFEVLDFLNRQNISRERYEVIWVEYYSTALPEIKRMLDENLNNGRHPVLDQWIVMGIADNVCFHRHLMYNIGILTSRGKIICFCDTDCLDAFFVENVINLFHSNKNIVLRMDDDMGECTRLSAFREDLIEIGGADEHKDFLGYSGGLHDMAVRLSNAGKKTMLHTFEGRIETIWQPNPRILPLEENPSIRACRTGLESYALQPDYNTSQWAVE